MIHSQFYATLIKAMAVRILQFDTYLDVIKKSVGSNLFQSVFAEVNGERMNITNRGQFSCAVHVSSILLWFGLLKERHTGVDGLVVDMIDSGWYEIDKPKVGCIIRWEKKLKNGGENEHVGFYISDDSAVSNDPVSGAPIEHHYTYGETDGRPNRKIETIYWHPKLDIK